MRIVTVGRKTLKLWDSYDGEELCRYPTVDDVNVAVWSPDGTRVVAGTSLGAVLLLQVEDHRMIPAHVIRLGQRSDSLTNITGGTNASDESRIGVQLVSSGVFQKRGFYEEFESQGDPGPPAKRFTCKKCGAKLSWITQNGNSASTRLLARIVDVTGNHHSQPTVSIHIRLCSTRYEPVSRS